MALDRVEGRGDSPGTQQPVALAGDPIATSATGLDVADLPDGVVASQGRVDPRVGDGPRPVPLALREVRPELASSGQDAPVVEEHRLQGWRSERPDQLPGQAVEGHEVPRTVGCRERTGRVHRAPVPGQVVDDRGSRELRRPHAVGLIAGVDTKRGEARNARPVAEGREPAPDPHHVAHLQQRPHRPVGPERVRRAGAGERHGRGGSERRDEQHPCRPGQEAPDPPPPARHAHAHRSTRYSHSMVPGGLLVTS